MPPLMNEKESAVRSAPPYWRPANIFRPSLRRPAGFWGSPHLAAHTFFRNPKNPPRFFFSSFPCRATAPRLGAPPTHALMRRSLARSHLGLSISLQHGSSSRSLLPLLAQQAVHQVALLPRSPRFVLRFFPRGSRVVGFFSRHSVGFAVAIVSLISCGSVFTRFV